MSENPFAMSTAGCHLLATLEGIRYDVYTDTNGNRTIGIGHLITDEDPTLEKITGLDSNSITSLTASQVNQLFNIDLGTLEAEMIELIEVELEQHQIDAIVSLAFNIGIGNFKKSTALEKINSNLLNEVPDAILLWDGHGVPGVVKRRVVEANVWSLPFTDVENNLLTQDLQNEAFADITIYRGSLAADSNNPSA